MNSTQIGWAITAAMAGLIGYGLAITPWVNLGLTIIPLVLAIRPKAFGPRLQQFLVWLLILGLLAVLFARFDLSFDYMLDRFPSLLGLELRDGFLQGAALSLFISLISIACAAALGLVFALLRLSDHPASMALGTFYVSFFRGTPLLLQALVIYLGLPQIGVAIDAIPAGIIALSLCYGAYLAEIFRAGIEAIPKGQIQAAYALGLNGSMTMRHVVLPQAMVLIIPPIGNQFISMLKDSALVSVMGVWELTFIARMHGRASFRYLEMMIAAGIIYWVLSALFEFAQSRLEARYGKGVRV